MAAALLAFAWVLGVCAAALTGGDEAALVAAAVLCGLAAFLLKPTPFTLLLLPALVALAAIGFAAHEATVPDPAQGVAGLNGQGEVQLRGFVDGPPSERETSRVYTIRVTERSKAGSWQDAEGRLMARVPLSTVFQYGDLIEIKGELEAPEPFSGFDYPEYLLRRGITSIAYYPEATFIESGQGNPYREKLLDIRSSITEALSDTLPQPHASLAAGVLIGTGGDLPADLRADMSATGTSHLVAVSGQNVSMFAALVIAALAWLIGRRSAAFIALGSVGAYVLLVGADASVLRAGVMGALYIVATMTGRQNAGPIALVYAAATMSALNPQVVHEISFQLSFAATLGLMTLAPILAGELRRFSGESGLARPVAEMLAITLAAIAFTLPISAATFGTVSLVAPIANVFVIPAFVLVAVTSGFAAAAVMLVPDSAQVVAWVAWPPTAYMLWVIEGFASLPFASIRLEGVGLGHVIAWYAVLAALVVWLQGHRHEDEPAGQIPIRRFAATGAIATVIAAGVGITWLTWSSGDESRVSVTVLDVGQGDSILIEDLSGHRVLVDGGPGEQSLAEALGRHLPFHDRRIDLVIATHQQADHVGGLSEVVDSYDVRGVISRSSESAGTAWTEALVSAGIPVTVPSAGQTISLDGASLEILQAASDVSDVNDQSVVAKLTSGEVEFLLTGDLGEEGERELLRSGAVVSADVLKVGHHGSRFSSTPAFLDRVGAQVSVISAGKSNPYGHPSPEVLDRLIDTAIFRTDQDGDVTVSTDGRQIWVETER